MKKIIILASSIWVKIDQKERDDIEKQYLKLAHYLMGEKIAGNKVEAIWFCSSHLLNEFIGSYKAGLTLITLPP